MGYKEDIRNIWFNKDESAFAQHILNKRHQYGRMAEIMEMVEHAKNRESHEYKRKLLHLSL
jgi:hypothetical protein